jgi:hypothetical protein
MIYAKDDMFYILSHKSYHHSFLKFTDDFKLLSLSYQNSNLEYLDNEPVKLLCCDKYVCKQCIIDSCEEIGIIKCMYCNKKYGQSDNNKSKYIYHIDKHDSKVDKKWKELTESLLTYL